MSTDSIKQIFSNDSKSREIQRDTLLIILFRGLEILCSFLIIPPTQSYLEKSDYGARLTLSSIMSWLSFMDVDLGNGLRNQFAEAVNNYQEILAKEYTRTAYVMFSIIMVGGFSKIKLYSAVFVGLLNILLCYYFAKHKSLGISSIALANCIWLLVRQYGAPLQCYKIITARGVESGLGNKCNFLYN